MLKVILDTNVILSGILFGGIPEEIIKQVLARNFIFCVSPTLEVEIIRKLEVKFPHFDKSIERAIILIERFGKKYIPKKKVAILRDKNDNFLLDLAQESNADYLVTGDKAVLDIKKYKKTVILSPKEFLALII